MVSSFFASMHCAMAQFTNGSISFNTAATSVSNATIDYADAWVNKTSVSRCAKQGHVMSEEVEWVDGSIRGICEVCGEQITGRRLAGGLGLRLLEVVMDSYLKGDESVTREDLTEIVLTLTGSLAAEKSALDDAFSMLRLAQELMLRRTAA